MFDDIKSSSSPDDKTSACSSSLVQWNDYIPGAKCRMITDFLSHLLCHATTDTSCSTEPLPASIAVLQYAAVMKSSGEGATSLWCLFNLFPRLKQHHWHHQRQPEDKLRTPGVACCSPTLCMLWFSPESQQLCCTPAPAGVTGSIRFSKLALCWHAEHHQYFWYWPAEMRAPDKGARRGPYRGVHGRAGTHAEQGRKMVWERGKENWTDVFNRVNVTAPLLD